MKTALSETDRVCIHITDNNRCVFHFFPYLLSLSPTSPLGFLSYLFNAQRKPTDTK